MNSSTAGFTFYLMTKKGLTLLKSVIDTFGPAVVELVVGARDNSVDKDYYEEIKNLCGDHGISFRDRKFNPGHKGYAFAVGWRWIITNTDKLIIFHDSLLPRYRGFAPLVNALINGEKSVGVTALYAADTYDTGDIIAQESIDVKYPTLIRDAIDRIAPLYSVLACRIIEKVLLNAPLQRLKQQEDQASYSLWRDDEDYAIDWSWDAARVRRHVDATGFPYKGAYAMLNGRKARITVVEEMKAVSIENKTPGKVIFMNDKYPVVVTGNGLVKIKEARWDDDGSSIFPFRKFRSRLVRDQQYPIPFNRPWFTGNEVAYISDAVNRGHISGNGHYTKKCQQFFEEKYGFRKCLLTTSCTDALEMSAILLDIQPGDEVIMPAFTFVSTANAFVLRGAKIVFVDSRTDHPGMDEHKLEGLITPSTKAIVVVHYGGIACDMDVIMALAEKHRLFVVEDAAQAVDSYYKGKPLGGFGHLGCFSFHETKNLSSGEGGMLVVNDDRFRKRAEIIWEKGTNRAAFFRGEVDKYGWVDVGSSFLPSDLIAAVLWAQLEVMDKIAGRRNEIWQEYFEALKPLEAKGWFRLPVIPGYATNNAHVFYLVMNDAGSRAALIQYLKKAGIMAVFHYQSLNKSGYYDPDNSAEKLPNSSIYSDCLVRLPLYFQLLPEQQKVINSIRSFFEKG